MSATNVVTLQQPAPVARWIVLDIETSDAPDTAVEAAIAAWKAPSNWKPETVEKNRAEAAEKIRAKAALLDASPIACVAMQSDLASVVFSSMGAGSDIQIPGWAVAQFADEATMLTALRLWLDGCSDESTILAGHNVRGFDLPKLRNGYVRHRLVLPRCLRPRLDGPGQNVVDTMRLFTSFSMEHRDAPFISLDVVCLSLGIGRPKDVIDGSMVPQLVREGRAAEVCTYCAVDVAATAEAFRLMTSH